MRELITSTSRGRVTIPIKIRREMGLLKKTKLLAYMDGESLVLRPTSDISSLENTHNHKTTKNK